MIAKISYGCICLKEEQLFKLVVRKHSDGGTVVRHFDPVPVTDEHFIWNSESWLDDDFYQIIKNFLFFILI
jgi:hypothetical protein